MSTTVPFPASLCSAHVNDAKGSFSSIVNSVSLHLVGVTANHPMSNSKQTAQRSKNN